MLMCPNMLQATQALEDKFISQGIKPDGDINTNSNATDFYLYSNIEGKYTEGMLFGIIELSNNLLVIFCSNKFYGYSTKVTDFNNAYQFSDNYNSAFNSYNNYCEIDGSVLRTPSSYFSFINFLNFNNSPIFFRTGKQKVVIRIFNFLLEKEINIDDLGTFIFNIGSFKKLLEFYNSPFNGTMRLELRNFLSTAGYKANRFFNDDESDFFLNYSQTYNRVDGTYSYQQGFLLPLAPSYKYYNNLINSGKYTKNINLTPVCRNSQFTRVYFNDTDVAKKGLKYVTYVMTWDDEGEGGQGFFSQHYDFTPLIKI